MASSVNSRAEIAITAVGFVFMLGLPVAVGATTTAAHALILASIELLCFSVGGRMARHVAAAELPR